MLVKDTEKGYVRDLPKPGLYHCWILGREVKYVALTVQGSKPASKNGKPKAKRKGGK